MERKMAMVAGLLLLLILFITVPMAVGSCPPTGWIGKKVSEKDQCTKDTRHTAKKADAGVVISEGGKKMSFKKWLAQQKKAPGVSNAQAGATLIGAILGIIGSTVIPYIISLRRNPDNSFEYSYLWNAFLSAIVGGLSVMETLSPNNPMWWFLLMAFLTTAGVKKGIGDTVLDTDRKKRRG